jgi:chromosome segregation ATPase
MGDKLGVAALVRSDTKMALLLKDIEAAYQTPGVDQKAVNLMIDDVNRRIFNLRALDKGGKKDEFKKGIEEEQKQAEADVNKKKQEEKAKADKLKEFQGKCSALKKRIDAVEKKVADAKGSKEDVDAARSIASTAESISKNGELKDAEEKLAVADNKVTQLENNPGGFAMESAKELGKAPERWTAAIEEAKAAIDEVAGEAEKLALQAGKDKNVVAEKVKSVKTLFKTPAMLGAPLKTLRDEQAKPEAQKAAREQILREIRELRTMMDTNPVLQLVRRSPFKTKIPVTLGIKKFLDSLELNTLRAVRPQK